MRKTRWLTVAVSGALIAGLLSPALAAGSPAPPTAAPGTPVSDPIPADPVQSGLGLVLKEHHRFPKTEPVPAPTDARLMRQARINYLGEIPDRTKRQYVPDLNGPLYVLDKGRRHLYLDVRQQFPDFFSGRGMGSGFGFVSFHPEYAENGIFYTTHTEAGAALSKPTTYPAQPKTFLHGVVTEWTADDPRANTFVGTRREMVRLGFATQVHGIQQIDVNPTASRRDADYGLLYLAVGDGGTGLNTDVPQQLDSPYGKILRIDPNGTSGPGRAYGIPAANPFVSEPGALGEIWSYGMRDPHRFSWDPAGANRMYLGHIGQHGIESVYEVRAGDNLGWSEREGRFVYDPSDECNLYTLPADDAGRGYVYPVAAYDHDPPPGWPCNADSGHGISGGQVYRGPLKDLRGLYVFGDIVDGRVLWTEADRMRQELDAEAPIHEMALFDTSGRQLRMTDLARDVRVDLRFGTDAKGGLYLLSKANGTIWEIVGTKRAKPVSVVLPALAPDVVAGYDFEHPFAVRSGVELDQGSSDTLLTLVNGGKEMRVDDGAFPRSNNALELKQLNPTVAGNDDWKAGVWDEAGVSTLEPFRGAEQVSVMGWFKMTGENPALNSRTPASDDRFNAVGLAGVLSGNSDGHGVRALLELIQVDGELKLVALGRRLDDGASQTFAASEDWKLLLPVGQWVHLAATFNYITGEMALYRNGVALDGRYTTPGDPWERDGTGSSSTLPRGLKIGGSYPQNTQEQNPCTCRMDSLMFLDRAVTPAEVQAQYQRFMTAR